MYVNSVPRVRIPTSPPFYFMRNNLIDQFLGITCFGESHGRAFGILLEDVKPGIVFPLELIQKRLNARKPSSHNFSTSRMEEDKIEIISGIFEGKTTGMPICLLVYNYQHNSSAYDTLKEVFRPGHADFAYYHKYKIYDYRGGGRASGRETISRIIAGALVENTLGDLKIHTYPVQINSLIPHTIDLKFSESNPLHWPCIETYASVLELIDSVKAEKDSLGGIVEMVISNVPVGLGDPIMEKLDANLAKALISIGAVKGIEFGLGFQIATLKGSQANDQLNPEGFLSNNSGGILGGISTGQNIVLRFVVKPTPSIGLPQKTVNKNNQSVDLELQGRFDTLIIPRLIPVAEAMVRLVLADAIAYQKLLTDEKQSMPDYREAIDKIDEDILLALYRRRKIVEQVQKYKIENNLPPKDSSREKELIAKISAFAEDIGLSSEEIPELWQKIIVFTGKSKE